MLRTAVCRSERGLEPERTGSGQTDKRQQTSDYELLRTQPLPVRLKGEIVSYGDEQPRWGEYGGLF
ncbi:MAG: hypothetical protein ACFB4I_19430 [Cyanophyceae cyanobacterium]